MSTRRLGELEDVIGEVAASYGAGRLIDSLSSAQLPNKRQVIEALNHLKAVMYLGYYATGELHEQKLRYAVVGPSLSGLRDPGASRSGGRSATRASARPACRATPTGRRPSPSSSCARFLRIRALLSKDVLAAFQGDPAANGVEEVIFSYPSIEAITIHRIAHELHRAGRADAAAHHGGARALDLRDRHPPRRARSASRSSSTTAPAS